MLSLTPLRADVDDVGHFAGDDVAVMVMIFLDRLIFVQNKKVILVLRPLLDRVGSNL